MMANKVMWVYSIISILVILLIWNLLGGTAEAEEKQEFEITEYPINQIEIVIVEPETPMPLYSDAEIDLMARVVMSEASILSIEGKQAVAQTILNRVASVHFPDTIEEVVHQPFQYSTANNGEPTDECYEAVKTAIDYPQAFPEDLYFFRTGHYHSYGIPYMHIGNTYFSQGGN